MTDVQPPLDLVQVPMEEQAIDYDAMLANAEKAVAFQRRLLPVLVRLTHTSDWTFFGAKARINEGGVSRIASALGLTFTNIQPRDEHGNVVPRRERYTDEKGDEQWSYSFTCTVSNRFGTKFEGVRGSCTTKDKFFMKIGNDDNGHPIYREYREVDPNNLIKKAYANLLVNGAELAAMIKGVTKEMLVRAGLNVEAIDVVEFKGKTGERQKKSGKAGVSKALSELIELCMTRAEGDPSVAREYLKAWSTFEGKDGSPVFAVSFEKLKGKEKWIGAILRAAREDEAFDDEFSEKNKK